MNPLMNLITYEGFVPHLKLIVTEFLGDPGILEFAELECVALDALNAEDGSEKIQKKQKLDEKSSFTVLEEHVLEEERLFFHINLNTKYPYY